MVCVASLLGLAACGSDDGSSADSGREREESEIARGGTLRIGTVTEPTFNPLEFTYASFLTNKNLYDSLMETDEDRNPVPSLATGFTMAPDNLSATVKLRDGVEFQSGTPLTADSILPTLAAMQDPKTGGLFTAVLAVVAKAEAPAPNTLQFTFKTPQREEYIGEMLEMIRPIDPAGLATVKTAPAGTGPFLLESYTPGTETRLKKNPNYWRSGEPYLDEIVIRKFSDADAAAAALESGEVDMIYPATTVLVERLGGQGYELEASADTQSSVLALRAAWTAPFDNDLVRRAMVYVIDREVIAEEIFNGVAQPEVLPWTDDNIGTDPQLDMKFGFDLEEARQLLDQSGLSNDQLAFSMVVQSSIPSQVLTAQKIQSDLKSIGVEMNIELVDMAGLIDHIVKVDFQTLMAPTSHAQRIPTFINAISNVRADATNTLLKDKIPQPYVDAMIAANDPSKDLASTLPALRTAMLENPVMFWICTSPEYISVHTDNVRAETGLQDNNSFTTLRTAYIQP